MNFKRFNLTVKLLIALCGLIATGAYAQQRQIDSLHRLLPAAVDSTKIMALNELSWIYKNSNVDSSVIYARKALALSQQKKNYTLIAKSLNSLGNSKQASGDYDSALFYLKQSVNTSLAHGDTLRTANVLNNIGIIYDEKGDYDKALQSYFKGLDIAKLAKQETVEAYILTNIGIVYKKQKQYDKVLEYYSTALEIYKKIKSNFGISVTSGNIGSVLLQTKDYDRSIQYSLAAKKGYEELGYTRYVPYTYGNMAIAYDSLHQAAKAESFYKMAYEQHLKFENQYEAAYNSKNLVFFYLKNRKTAEAKKYADAAISLASKIGAKEMLRDAYDGMSRINMQLGNYKEALRYQQKFVTLKDSLYEGNKTKTILELQVKYETEAKELELAEQEVQLKTNALELEQRNLQMLGLGSAILLLIISGTFIYKSLQAKRRKLEQETKFQLQLADAKLENELHQDRLRISRDLHDNIGSRLLFLYTATESLADKSPSDKAEQISEFARNTLHELRRTVWFINKDEVTLEELQLKLKDYFNFLNESPNLKIETILETDPSLVIPSPKAAAVFRVAQEGVSNAIKYAQATHIKIHLLVAGNRMLELKISDNGKGFDANAMSDGNGLKNMRLHASNAKGLVNIKSEIGSGTTILLALPLD